MVFLYAGSAIYIYEATTMAGSSCEDISISGGHDPRNCTWSDEVASDIRRYLERGQYPAHLPHSDTTKRRNFRKRAKDFVVHKDNLYYKGKKNDPLRLAISSKEDQERVFQVGTLSAFLSNNFICDYSQKNCTKDFKV